MDAVEGALSADALTYNGNPSFSTIGKPHLDFFAGVTRHTDEEDISHLALKCLREDVRLALVTFFQKRDCREGAGERKPFILALSKLPAKLRRELYQFVPEYGYWDDLNKFASTIPEDCDFIAAFLAKRLYRNMEALGKDPSQGRFDLALEKWLPTEGQADDIEWNATDKIIDQFNKLSPSLHLRQPAIDAVIAKVKEQALKVNPDASISYSMDSLTISCDTDGWMSRKYLHLLKKAYALPEKINRLTPAGYRKWCSFARAFTGVIEHFKSTGEWDLIEYSTVPSIAFSRTEKQFEQHDPKRFKEFLDQVKAGKSKINVSRLMPFELFEQEPSEVMDEQWRLIVEETRKFYLEVDPYRKSIFHPANSIHVADVSGSMLLGNPSLINISRSLAFLMAEVGQRAFYTFSGKPKRYEPIWRNLTEAQEMVVDNNCNTDLELLINRIYEDCVQEADREEVPPSEKIPGSIFIYTDGGFDEMCHMKPMTAVEYIQKKFSGLRRTPIIVFWNVAGNTQDFAVSDQIQGCIQLAGFSKDLYTTFTRLSGPEDLTPETFFRKAVLRERYQPILTFFDEWREQNKDIDLAFAEKKRKWFSFF